MVKKANRKNCFIDIIYLFWILVFSIIVCWPLLGKELLPGHDAESGFIKVVSMSRYWGDGQILVRWVPDLFFGYGYAMFNFYQPLFSYLAAFLTWIFHHPVLGLNSACFIVVFLSGVAMYIAVKDWFGHDAALVSAIAYLFSPYHILELYVRAAYAELTSFIFFPLILWALYRLSKTFQRRYFILGIVFLSGLILAHQLSNFIFFPFMIGYLLFLCGAEPKTYSNQYLFLSLLMIFLAFSITSFFWVPALLEKKFVNMDILVKGQFNYRWHFLYPYQLFKARWNYGYSCPGPYDGMDFHLGYAHILLVIISFVFFIKKYKDSKQVVKFFIIFAVMAIIAVFFTLPFSSRIWERIPLMHFVQFPWRYLMIVSFAISVLVGAWAFFKIPYQKYFLAFAIGLIFLINISYCHPPTSKNIDFQKGFDSGRYNSPLDHVEFISIWTKRVPSKFPKNKLEVWLGDAVVEREKRISSVKYFFEVHAYKDSILCFHTFYFPGWRVFVDGKETPIDPDNESGLIVFKVPSGKHKVIIHFGLSSVRLAGILISIASLAFLFFLIFFKKIWGKRISV